MALQGRLQDSIEHYESYLTPVDQIFTNPLFPRIAGVLVIAYQEVGQVNLALGIAKEIAALAERNRDSSLKVFASYCRAIVDLSLGIKEEARTRLIRIVEQSKQTEEIIFKKLAYMELAALAAEEKDWPGCVEMFDQSIRLGIESGTAHRYFTSAYCFALAGVEMSRQSAKNYWPTYEQAIERFREDCNPHMTGYALLAKATQLRWREGSIEERKRLLIEAKSSLLESGSKMGTGRLELEWAWIALEQNRKDEIQRHIREARTHLRYQTPNLIPAELSPFMTQDSSSSETIVLQEVVDLISSMSRLELNPLLAKGLRSLCELCNAPWAGIWLPDEAGTFNLAAGCNLTEFSLDSAEFKPILSVIQQVGSAERFIEKKIPALASARVLPLNIRSGLIGILCYGRSLLPDVSEMISEDLMKLFASLFAIEIDHARNYAKVQEFTKKLKEENSYYRDVEFSRENFREIIGNSPQILVALEAVSRVAPTSSTVLLQGETGSGKELFARAIHQASKVSEGPFIQINCAAIPAELIESELFGHERGAFTGAIARKPGRLELANQGTLLLDEIGELSQAAQAKLLRVLQERKFVRVGGTKTIESDFRLIAATHKDLREMVEAGQFREDLYYRLTVFPITIPPLRERKDDIPLLVLSFLKKREYCLDGEKIAIPETEMQKLVDYHWPGNVRELINIIERGVILSQQGVFRVPPLASPLQQGRRSNSSFKTLEEMEKEYILTVLAEVNGKVAGAGGAAEILGVNRSTLYGRMRRLGIK
jgi:transcriptional regulator with GAF, ATPase, and Fis domain/tetratricopeptide (TPR) repeat protein